MHAMLSFSWIHALVPAFQPRRAFEMGFLLLRPFTLIVFVLVDGWRLVSGSLVQSFSGP